jgi:hypothetical protein
MRIFANDVATYWFANGCFHSLHHNGEWNGRAADLEQILTNSSDVGRMAHRLFGFSSACGTYLARLEDQEHGRVTSVKSRGYTHWTIRPLPKTDSENDEGVTQVSDEFKGKLLIGRDDGSVEGGDTGGDNYY